MIQTETRQSDDTMVGYNGEEVVMKDGGHTLIPVLVVFIAEVDQFGEILRR